MLFQLSSETFLIKVVLTSQHSYKFFQKNIIPKKTCFLGAVKNLPFHMTGAAWWLKHFLKDKEKALYSQWGYKN